MSFRGRLTLFFVLIVAVPMVAVVLLVAGITGASRSGKADARLAGGVHTALSIYRDDLAGATRAARAIATDPAVNAALASGQPAAIGAALDPVARSEGARSVVVRSSGGGVLARVGSGGVAIARIRVNRPGGAPAATIFVSTTSGHAYVTKAKRLTGLDVNVFGPTGTVAGTAAASPADLPPSGHSSDVTAGGGTMRATTARLPGAGGFKLAVIGPIPSAGFLSSTPLVAAALIAFLAVAILLVSLLLRTLSGQVSAMLAAARGIGRGDFSGEVPVIGSDEMAGLAEEFNKMSGRLSTQMGQLRRQRDEIERSVQRIGAAFASGLDRPALLKIVAETAISACNASYGVIALGGHVGDEAEAGEPSTALRDAIVVAEERATRGSDTAEHCADGACALAAAIVTPGAPDPVGVMSIARAERPFDDGERDVFRYLVGQAAASIENIALHELVSEQAITDDLTGLSNKRRFRDLVIKEAARAERFGHPLSLLMLDIDDFKRVNDTNGHPQGDEVLRRIARVLEAESRWVDEPARYGGEEFAIALPETGPEGAYEVAERIRSRVESEEIPLLRGGGTVHVTASIGVATSPATVGDVENLVSAADAALYESKRAGKNRVTAAGGPIVDRRVGRDSARAGPKDPRTPAGQ